MTIHWCGTGLSAVPGLRTLLTSGADVVVWNRTTAKAAEAVGDLTDDIRAFDLATLSGALAAGDVVVSMLPADWHVPLAQAALEAGAHFVSSSYISPEMRALDGAARDKGLCLVNEVGLDPGIDHLMAHELVGKWRSSDDFDSSAELSFTSYCGGFPKIPNEFRYKFSWSPLGVLKALRSPSRSIRDWEVLEVDRPWQAITRYEDPRELGETFEAYPNRDSVPFIAEYEFGKDWNVRNFVRGTLRLDGWSEAWADVFREIETLDGPEGDARLAEMSDDFWSRHAYGEGEADRVVLFVTLTAKQDDKVLFDQTWAMDARGTAETSAMGRLVSQTVRLAVQAVIAGEIAPGVSAAPSDPEITGSWLGQIAGANTHLEIIQRVG
ncbi:saccharopine dehydrogenase family protein [Pseudooceanicola aestuarii]|uniref:saccharopine dehydrogenase family protein n=1 Tax=Pseudooceanicola aestuarii TaxID=2697319 RepID=UPI0013D682F9|nr:saccharopine dehydrogenase family protein [Pseudooceanicola aestuarii]